MLKTTLPEPPGVVGGGGPGGAGGAGGAGVPMNTEMSVVMVHGQC